MATRITGPREFFLELKSLFQAVGHDIAAGCSSNQTKDALARVLSYVNEREMELPKLPPVIAVMGTFELSARDIETIDTARDVFVQVYRGNTKSNDPEVFEVLSRLNTVMPRLSPTWSERKSS